MDNTSEILGFDALQEMQARDRKVLLTALEHAAIGSGIKVVINGREVNIVEEVVDTQGDSMLIADAYMKDPHAILTPVNILSEGEDVKKAVVGGRAGKKVGGNVTMFGVDGVLASMQGIEVGIIPQGLNDNNEATELQVYLSKNGKQIKPAEIGADKWKLSPGFENIVTPARTDQKGTMIFTAKPVFK